MPRYTDLRPDPSPACRGVATSGDRAAPRPGGGEVRPLVEPHVALLLAADHDEVLDDLDGGTAVQGQQLGTHLYSAGRDLGPAARRRALTPLLYNRSRRPCQAGTGSSGARAAQGRPAARR